MIFTNGNRFPVLGSTGRWPVVAGNPAGNILGGNFEGLSFPDPRQAAEDYKLAACAPQTCSVRRFRFRDYMKETQLTWYGQSAFKIVTPGGKVLLVDPWLTNPLFEKGAEEIAALKHVDLIFITHGHSDHVGDAVEIGKRTRAKLVATFDLADAMVKHLGFPADQAEGETIGHFGGELTLLEGEVKVAFVRAHHGSGVAADDRYGLRHGGTPGGFVITIRGGPTIYHTGDTDLFSDMALLTRFHKIDIMLVCIGDHFTMGPALAAEAVKLVKARTVIPMHYGTFPILTGTPEAFGRELKERQAEAELRVMKVGETVSLGGGQKKP
jgi:L-ascorbate metabolism protein UlaG (beta-lactamase superfamily)